jgi:predicted transcriptional regulator
VKITLNTDTRQVRRDQHGFFRSGAGKNICDHCAARNVCAYVDQMTACREFLPALPFTDETGLEKIANTMRIGRAWTQRLDIPQTVALYNAKTKVIFGYADVISMDDGNIVSMLKRHAAANHLMLATPYNECAVKPGAWLMQTYGPRIIHENTTVTCLYLLRIGEPPAAPHLQGVEADGPGEGGTAGGGQAD